ncbi:MAG: DUF2182 domain-containing protein [Acetobacteraceae bacterium]
MLARLLRRDRALVLSGLVAATLLAWIELCREAGGAGMAAREMPVMAGSPQDVPALVSMWIVMMAAMMLPSAAPMILLYATIARRRREQGHAAVGAGLFTLGYGVVWASFGLAAALLQVWLAEAALLSPTMATTSVGLAGAVLIGAGLYQWSPLKQACLRRCQSPLEFLLGHWREGGAGAVRMGLLHGAVCLGCCWALMGVLFVGGVMNLLWVTGLAGLILVEKMAPPGAWLGRIAGAGLIVWGGFVLRQLAA